MCIQILLSQFMINVIAPHIIIGSHVITRPPFATMATNEDPSNRIINVPQTTQETQQSASITISLYVLF